MEELQDGKWRYGAIPKPTLKNKEAARACLPIIEERLQPAEKEGIKAAIVVLLTHYYTADLPEHVYQAIAYDWIACLHEYPAWAIEQARIEYLKTYRKKPVPADISAICARIISKDKCLQIQCERVLGAPVYEEPPELTPEQKAEAGKRVSQMLEECKKNLSGGMTEEERAERDAVRKGEE